MKYKGFLLKSVFCIVVLGAMLFNRSDTEKGYTLSIQTPIWGTLPSLPQNAGDSSAFILKDTLYHTGGWAGNPNQPIAQTYALLLEPPGTSWNTLTEIPAPARFGAATVVAKEHAYVLGGYGGTYLTRVDSFDGTTWRQERDLSIAVWSPSAAVTQDRIYIAGGEIGAGNMTNQVWSSPFIAEGKLGDWRQESYLPSGLITRLAAHGKCLYVVGGKDSGGGRHAEVYRTVLTSDGQVPAWSQTTVLPRPLALHAVAIDQNTLYVLGGETVGGALNDQIYSISINSDTCALVGAWTSSPLPGGGNRRLSAASRFGELYILGGQTTAGYTNAVWKGILPIPDPSLTLQKSATLEGDFDYGKLITYTLNYANTWSHPDGQTGVIITDTVPISTTFVSASRGITPTDGILHWDIDALQPGEGGVVSFTVQVDEQPVPQWELSSAQKAIWFQEEGTWLLQSEVIYTIIYTPSMPVDSGILVTGTLPSQLYPKDRGSITSSLSGSEFALNGQNVIWRVPGVITQTGYLTVTTCVTEGFSTQLPLNYSVWLQDIFSHTQHINNQAVASDVEGWIKPSCTEDTLQLGYPTTVSPLVPMPPDIVIRNRAWIYSNELAGCLPSNETITRYWPAKIFLPLVIKQ